MPTKPAPTADTPVASTGAGVARAVAAIAAAEKTTGLLAFGFLDGGPPLSRSTDGDGPSDDEGAVGDGPPCAGCRSRSGEAFGVAIALLGVGLLVVPRPLAFD